MNEQVKRGKDVHMISCLVNVQIERCKHVHRMVLFGEYTSRERQDVHMISCLVNIQAERGKDVHMMVLIGEWTSGERQRCSYDGAVW